MARRWSTFLHILIFTADFALGLDLAQNANDISVEEDPPPLRRKHFIPSIERMPHYPSSQYDEFDAAAIKQLNNQEPYLTLDGNSIQNLHKRIASITAMDIKAHKDRIKKRETRGKSSKGVVKNKVRAHSNLRRLRSIRSASYPAVEAVDENSPIWKRLSTEKPQFVTSKTHRPQALAQQGRSIVNDDDKVKAIEPSNPKTNEISNNKPMEYERKKEYLFRNEPYRYPLDEYNRYDDGRGNPSPQRGRIIYYADLPEVVRHGPQDLGYPYLKDRGPYSRYEAYPDDIKYPRESRYEDSRSLPVSVPAGDRYRYQPQGRNRFTIIDAPEDRGIPPRYPYQNYQRSPPPPPLPPAARDYYDTPSRYNRIPAPYSPLSSRSQYDRAPSNEDLSRRYPYTNNREAVRPASGAGYSTAPNEGEDPYRDYNPRQPAPWSMQIGARLTVKDDGRPMAARPGRPGRPFYVQSQGERDQYSSRYRRDKDTNTSLSKEEMRLDRG